MFNAIMMRTKIGGATQMGRKFTLSDGVRKRKKLVRYSNTSVGAMAHTDQTRPDLTHVQL